jgi:hypothetical protein
LPSFHPYSTSRAAPLPSPMPSIVFGQRANFSSRKWERLAQDDIRSSSHNPRFCSLSNTSISPARDIFSSAGRRSVRR